MCPVPSIKTRPSTALVRDGSACACVSAMAAADFHHVADAKPEGREIVRIEADDPAPRIACASLSHGPLDSGGASISAVAAWVGGPRLLQ